MITDKRSAPPGSPVLSAASALRCPHGGRVTVSTADPGRAVRVDGATLATVGDAFTVTGCPHTAGGRPSPCATVRWGHPAGDAVRTGGVPVLPASATAQCLSATLVPQGPPLVVPAGARGVTCR